jgi:hypothetical protein
MRPQRFGPIPKPLVHAGQPQAEGRTSALCDREGRNIKNYTWFDADVTCTKCQARLRRRKKKDAEFFNKTIIALVEEIKNKEKA